MKLLVLALAMVTCGEAGAVTLSPVVGDSLNGIPLAQAMASMEKVGEWQLLSGGQVRLITIMSRRPADECGVSELDDADTCGRITMFVSANGETSVPVDFTVFRLPETLGWTVPKSAQPESDFGKFSITLSACEMKKTAKGMGWKGTSYTLHVTETLSGKGEYVFAANLDQLPGERPNCAN